jgi:transglutaminase-like putative cysteine protease
MKRYRVVHTTEYGFDQEAGHVDIHCRLKPGDDAVQHCEYFQIISIPPADLQDMPTDAFGNHAHRLCIDQPLQRLKISAVSTVGLSDGGDDGPCKTMDDGYRPPAPLDLSLFLEATRLTPLSRKIRDYASHGLQQKEASVRHLAETLSRRIYSDLTFEAGVTDIRTDAGQVLSLGRGVCQDFAHLALACARTLGWPARYISGYVHTAPFRGAAHRIAEDASHAWFEVFDPRAGWVGLDPANNRRVDHHYITVARGRDYNDACPLQGTFDRGSVQRLNVSVDVQQIK